MRRRLAYALSALVVLVSSVTVPLPLVELAPGTTVAVAPLIRLATTTTPIEGSVELLTIQVRTPTLVDAFQAWLSPTRELDRRERVIPPGVDETDYFRIQRQQFERSFRVAVAVGLRAAGESVEVTTRPILVSVLPGGPAGGVLEAGDVVLEALGTEVTSGDELVAALRDVSVGDIVTLTIDRGGETRQVEVRAGRVPGLDRPGVGIAIETIANDVELPYDVELDERSGIGGASAGLAFALAVYDLVSEEDLTRGRIIAATGTIDAAGNVGPIGGLLEKVAAAEDAGADLLLVPRMQGDAAGAARTGELRIAPVATLAEALEVLREDAG